MPFLATAWRWFTHNPVAQFVAAFVLALIGWSVVKRNIQETGRIQERERIAAAQAQTKAAVIERSTEIIQEERQYADSALEARDNSAPAPSFDELPDEIQRVLNRSARGHQAS
jgi:hypothetical protein